MSASQLDLFGTQAAPAREPVDEEILKIVRKRLHDTLALVQGAEKMPWDDMMTIIHEDNGFRYRKDFLPPEEGAALWAAFDAEMDRLYAIMNEGKEFEPDE